jgi:hypothetical protein
MFQRFLAACRFLLIIPVVGCVLLTLGVVLMGLARIVTNGTKVVQAGDYSAKAAKAMSLAVIEIIDLFLIGTVAYITAVGLYKLFIDSKGIRTHIDDTQGGDIRPVSLCLPEIVDRWPTNQISGDIDPIDADYVIRERIGIHGLARPVKQYLDDGFFHGNVNQGRLGIVQTDSRSDHSRTWQDRD